MSDLLKVADEIETKLKEEGLVGKRIGSGFCFIDNSRDVQFFYNDEQIKKIAEVSNRNNDRIIQIVDDVFSKYGDVNGSVNFKLDNFTFYVRPNMTESEIKEECVGEEDVDESIQAVLLDKNECEFLLKLVKDDVEYKNLYDKLLKTKEKFN